ncbi:UDP-N-acetylmuramoyl-L-alanine--D-glutamate ligase [Allokutzneria sp. NRRL B-24872]|uniref:UDP-N-acetylmuramoyl-L-alanine--D-glutamate ligase n=1 Tax=Allokutzneria sp. NRRL B-24872 TaxID=1137961 RepID=UPI000A35E78E|nr:UDP-N-acetylmuramoyl-L-alanine--D-glutamate ligase [Allokutzneria sp. NRRL B-24872]
MTYAGKSVLVAGAGVSGRSAAAALLAEGAAVTVTDSAPDRFGGLDAGIAAAVGLTAPPEGTDLVVTSPGWRPSSPLLVAAAEQGVEVIGEVEFAWRLAQHRPNPPAWLAVTGTNGKTTTVTMLASILRAAGVNAVACGNVGLPVVAAVRAGYDVLAVELSSFQLHWSSSLRMNAAAVVNIAEDHIDWHGSLEEYAAAKGKIYAGDGVAIYNADDAWSTRLSEGDGGRRVGFTLGEPGQGQLGVRGESLVDKAFGDGDTVLADVADVHPPGPYNVANALAAAALARAHGVPAEAIGKGLRDFTPNPHRSALVTEHEGIRWIDDSKATNPHAAAASLATHDRVVWIAGGLLKGAVVDELVAGAADRLAGVVLLGRDRAVIAAALARHAPEVPVHEVTAGDHGAMTEVVRAARAMARPGDVVLLAPAAASMDMFEDYPHRGRVFAEAVRNLTDRAR